MAKVSGEVRLRSYAQRDNIHAHMYPIRASSKAHFSGESRLRALKDLCEEESRLLKERVSVTKSKRTFSETNIAVREDAQKVIARYYGVSVRTLRDWAAKDRGGKLETQPRSGQPRKVTSPLKRQIVDISNEVNGRSHRAVTAKLKSKVPRPKRGAKPFESKYKGKKRKSPGKTSVQKVLAEGEKVYLKVRPKLTKENENVRYEYARNEMAKTDEERNNNTVAIDESWICTDKAGTGRLIEHEKATPLTQKQKIRGVRNKNHPDKVLVLGVISRPKMLNKETAGPNEPAIFCPIQNGKVALMRCVEEQPYKKRVYETIDGQKILKHDVGESKFVSVTIDGPRYKDFLVRKYGVFDKIREYFGPDVRVRMQEDGAPGHGYNNKKNRSPTKPHDEMVAIANERDIDVEKQPHNSPETNPLDLGLWHSIQSRVKNTVIENGAREGSAWTESQIWEATKQAFWDTPSRTIWNCWMVKDEILKLLVANKGKSIAKEPHTGVRTRWGTHELSE
jgi:hypothetical protein